jgi:hypothetical protein
MPGLLQVFVYGSACASCALTSVSSTYEDFCLPFESVGLLRDHLCGWVGGWVCLPYLFPLGLCACAQGLSNLSRVLRGTPVDVVAGVVPLLVHPWS